METKITMQNGSTLTCIPPSGPSQAIRGGDGANISMAGLCKKLVEPPEAEKSWLAQKWSDLDMWWYVWKPQWCRTAGQFYWHHIRPIFAPQNRWAVKPVTRTWQDKCCLIEDWLYAAIIDFVEQEKCFEVTDWNDTEETRRLAAELREIYTWAKTGRAEFQVRIDKSIDEITMEDWLKSDVNWDEYNRLTDELEQWDTRCLEWIVRWRGILWT